jgi:hypothetical protein
MSDKWLYPSDLVDLDEKSKLAREILDSEPFMWLMAGSNHTEAQLQAIRPAYRKYREAGGGFNNHQN